MERRLAVILAADVVGYSALMERDEAGTHERLQSGRKELFEPEIGRHHGRIFKLMGDGLLAEFGSVVDAVECAASLQRGLAERNANVPEPERIEVRIGINLGEVIVEGDDRYGDGVNIATRLEQLAEPGGICVSGKVAKEVEKKLAFGFEPMGEQKVKNIAEPITVFRVKLDGVTKPPTHPTRTPWVRVAAMALALILAAGLTGGVVYWLNGPTPEPVAEAGSTTIDGKPSLVVLPFANMSDDKEQGYLADGITEDLTTELARIPGLFVISRTAAFTYKGKSIAPAQIGKELGVRYLLEGSTRRTGDAMRIHAQLIDTNTGGHIWAERFDGKWSEVFALQDKVVENIAGVLELRLVASSGKADFAGGTDNPTAYDAFLRGLEIYIRKNTPEEFAKAANYFGQALTLDPNFGAAAAELAWMHWDADDQRREALGLTWDEVDDRLYQYLEEASKHPSTDYYQLKAELLVRERKSDEAIELLNKAVALDPSKPWNYLGLSQAMIFNGRPKEGRASLDAAMRVDPGWEDWRYYQAGLAAFGQDQFEDAARMLAKIDPRNADTWTKWYGLQVLISAYGHLGRKAELEAAKAAFAEVLKERDEPPYDRLRTQTYFVYKNEADMMRLLDGLAKAGIPELPADFDPKPYVRMTGAEIKPLILGHDLRGHQTLPEPADYSVIYSSDGSVSVTIGEKVRKGITWTQGGFRCVAYPRDLTSCGAVFRNPTGTLAQANEYLFVFRRSRYEFSVVR